jgi:uncharacterized protein (DUF433 family)
VEGDAAVRRTCGSKADSLAEGATDYPVLTMGEATVIATNGNAAFVPLYTLSDAARYSRTPRANLRRWIEGYEVEGRYYTQLLVPPEDRPLGETALSFENLIEAALVSAWRRLGISLQRIRVAHDLAMNEFGEHPFARREVYFSGKDLFIEADEAVPEERGLTFTALTAGGQRVLRPLIDEYLRTIDWRTGDASPYQWRPPEGADVVKLNPRIEFGLPNVHRIRTEVILQRFMARETVEEIAEDFDLAGGEVEQALRYEWALSAAA